MAKKFLDDNGVAYLWQKLKSVFAGKADKSKQGITTPGTTYPVAAKTVAIDVASGYSSADFVLAGAVSDGFGAADSAAAIPTCKNVEDYVTGKGYATKASPAFTGTPTAPTAAAGTNSTQVATTAFVQTAVANAAPDAASETTAGVVKLHSRVDSTTDEALTPAAVNAARGSANGLCPLDGTKKVPSEFLPSYVDDVIEAYARSMQDELSNTWLSLTQGGDALVPETGKIYILMNTATGTTYPVNSQFRWSDGNPGTYVPIYDGGATAITNAEIDTILAN